MAVDAPERIDQDAPTGDQAFVIRIKNHERHRLKTTASFREVEQALDGEDEADHPYALEHLLALKARGLISVMLRVRPPRKND